MTAAIIVLLVLVVAGAAVAVVPNRASQLGVVTYGVSLLLLLCIVCVVLGAHPRLP